MTSNELEDYKWTCLRTGEELPRKATYYNCIFDETFGIYNPNLPHKHRVVKAKLYNKNQIVFLGSDGKIRIGCELKHFDFEDKI